MHRAQDGRHAAALVEDGQEGLPHVLVGQEGAVHQGKLVADELGEVRVQAQAALLGVEKNAHQPARLVAEDAVGGGVDFAVDEFEAVHRFAAGLRPPAAARERRSEKPEPPARAGQQRQALLEGAGDEEDVARVACRGRA